MTYLKRYGRGLGDGNDDAAQAVHDFVDGSAQCARQADANTQSIQDKVDDLAATWQPTGFYAPGDVRQIVGATMDLVRRAQTTIDQTRASLPSAVTDYLASVASPILSLLNLASGDPVADANARLNKGADGLFAAGQRSLAYLDAANTADQQGISVVNAPGLKGWVIDAMTAARQATIAASIAACMQPWWSGVLATIEGAASVAWSVAKAVAGVVVAAGTAAVNVAQGLYDYWDLIKWGVLAGGAWYLWKEYRR